MKDTGVNKQPEIKIVEAKKPPSTIEKLRDRKK